MYLFVFARVVRQLCGDMESRIFFGIVPGSAESIPVTAAQIPVFTVTGICRQLLICLIFLAGKRRLSAPDRQIPGSAGKNGKPMSRKTALGGSSSGPSIACGTSFLRDLLGEPIFPEAITVIDDPHCYRIVLAKPRARL
jgi:PmbA/TldA metallopeptidase C-terminal domain